jgi:16S rRNA (adenine1518-N6/adenine1519-N6)-dimethyltransferase
LNLTDVAFLRALLDEHGLHVSKRHGQHFLTSPAVVAAILDACPPEASVLEVGPGPGVLTRPLSQSRRTIAVEFDERLRPVLAIAAPETQIVWGDVLKTDLRALAESLPMPRALVSNMPYNITGPLLARFADLADLFARQILMMQREVADKVLAIAGDRNRGALSVDLQSRFAIRKIADAPGGAFWPPPKVDSAVLLFEPLPEQPHPGLKPLLRAGFAQPRKTLANNLASGLGRSRSEVVGWLESLGLAPDVRPAALDVRQWDRVRACADA